MDNIGINKINRLTTETSGRFKWDRVSGVESSLDLVSALPSRYGFFFVRTHHGSLMEKKMRKVLYVGLDVHAETIAVATVEDGRDGGQRSGNPRRTLG